MRVMGLDVGSKTVGIALSDELGWTAQGLKTLKINEEKSEFGFEEIGEIIKEFQVSQVVIGLPKKHEWNHRPSWGGKQTVCQ